MNKEGSSSLLIGMCSLLAVAGVIGPGPFRWVLLAIAGLIGLALAVRATRRPADSKPTRIDHSSYPEEISVLLERLSGLDLPEATVAPPLHRMLWRIGIKVPPPVLANFATNFALFFVVFAVGWGACMAVMFSFKFDVASNAIWLLGATLSASTMFAAALSLYFHNLARRHSLRG